MSSLQGKHKPQLAPPQTDGEPRPKVRALHTEDTNTSEERSCQGDAVRRKASYCLSQEEGGQEAHFSKLEIPKYFRRSLSGWYQTEGKELITEGSRLGEALKSSKEMCGRERSFWNELRSRGGNAELGWKELEHR